MHGTTAGFFDPKGSDVLLSENSDGICVYCAEHADGIDAKRQTTVCQRCARILSEWGQCMQCKRPIAPRPPSGNPFYPRIVDAYFAHIVRDHFDRSEWVQSEDQ
jgi:hypothetical protein